MTSIAQGTDSNVNDLDAILLRPIDPDVHALVRAGMDESDAKAWLARIAASKFFPNATKIDLFKYSDTQPRDAHGRWGVGDIVHAAGDQSGYLGRMKVTGIEPKTGHLLVTRTKDGAKGKIRQDQAYKTKQEAMTSLAIVGGGWGAAAQLSRPVAKGGAGSGNHGHAGRPGERGGSAAGGVSEDTAARFRQRYADIAEAHRNAPAARLASMRQKDMGEIKGNPRTGKLPMGAAEVYKSPAGVTVRFEKYLPPSNTNFDYINNRPGSPEPLHISDEDKLRVIDEADRLYTHFGQPNSVNVISNESMGIVSGSMPWDSPPFGASRLGGVDGVGGKPAPLLLNASTLDRGNEDFKDSASDGSFMKAALGADPMEYTMTHETGHMVDAPQTIERSSTGRILRVEDQPNRSDASEKALETIPAGSTYGRGAFGVGLLAPPTTGPNNLSEAHAESFAEYVLTNGKTRDKLSQALAQSEGWKSKL